MHVLCICVYTMYLMRKASNERSSTKHAYAPDPGRYSAGVHYGVVQHPNRDDLSPFIRFQLKNLKTALAHQPLKFVALRPNIKDNKLFSKMVP